VAKLGVTHDYPLSGLADKLLRAGDIDAFVETGTYVGDSLAWASKNFRRVWMVELNSAGPSCRAQMKNQPAKESRRSLLNLARGPDWKGRTRLDGFGGWKSMGQDTDPASRLCALSLYNSFTQVLGR